MVSGAGSGIGKATALRLQAEGARVVAVDISDEDDLMRSRDDTLVGSKTDVADATSVQHLVDTTVERWGRLDALCNCAGVATSKGAAAEVTYEEFDRVYRANLLGTFLMCRATVRVMIANGGGSIVNY